MKQHHSKRRSINGFTLIELMVVVIIISILASIAYPIYMDSVYKGRRSDGQKALLNVVNRQEQYFLDHKAYTNNVSNLGIPGTSEEGYYSIGIDTSCGTACYDLTATAIDAQSDDEKCTALTLSSTGTKNFTGTGSLSDCW